MPIWSSVPPDSPPMTGPETVARDNAHLVAGKPWVQVDNVSKPTITRFAPQGKTTGAAVVVFPGGGYSLLAIDLEGTEVCDWLASKGITAVLLKYRVPGKGKLPKSGPYPNSAEALQDAQRAIGLVRLHAPEWQIDPHRVGVLGFSAGGHLAAAVSTHFDKRLYPAVDDADKESCRPDFAIAVYPGHMLENTSKDSELNPFVPVTKAVPPTFLVHAEDDNMYDARNSVVYYAALKKAGVPTEMHLYPHGGHSFGLRRTDEPITHWPEVAETWLKKIGMLSQASKD